MKPIRDWLAYWRHMLWPPQDTRVDVTATPTQGHEPHAREQTTGASREAAGMDDHDTMPPVTDDEIRSMWRVAADDAASHRASVCGEQDGRCKHRRANLDECDGLMDVWLSRHGRP